MKKSGIKKFWERHEDEIKFAALVGLLVGGGFVIGYKVSRATLPDNVVKLDRDMLNFLKDSDIRYAGKRRWVNFSKYSEPIKLEDLGKLGEGFLKASGTKPDMSYTHFIAIGEYK